jgi:hypothetical protein
MSTPSNMLSALTSPIILQGDSMNAYRDPAAIYHEGVFYVFFTLVQTDPDGRIYSYTAEIISRDLQHWSSPEIITPKGQHLNYCGPGNIIRFNGEWILCLCRYPRLDYHRGDDLRWADEDGRAFITRSSDLLHWGEPELLKLKGPDVDEAQMGRIIDPCFVEDKDQPGTWWCFFKQKGVSMSRSPDLTNWTYTGTIDGGENACVWVDGDDYVLMYSPENGMGIKRSGNLTEWRDQPGLITLGQADWPWAQTRLTGGVVLDLRNEPGIGKYLMFFHAGGPGTVRTQDNSDAECSLGIAWSDDLVNWDWPR